MKQMLIHLLVPFYTEEEIEMYTYMKDNSDGIGFDSSMKDIADMMGFSLINVLKFVNKLQHVGALIRVNKERYNFGFVCECNG